MTLRRPSPGFTLLELLIGLALVGLILSLVFAGLRLGTRSWDAGEQRMAESSGRAQLLAFLRVALEQAYPYRWQDGGATHAAFFGLPDALAFVGPLPNHAGLGGRYLVVLRLEEGEEGQDLVLRWRPPEAGARDFSDLDEAPRVVLAKSVQGLEFAYFGSAGEAEAPAWGDQWNQREALPRLVRLRILPGHTAAWPDLVVALRNQPADIGGTAAGKDCVLC